jgi:hypothetical protein
MGKESERANCKSFACQVDQKAKLYVYGGPYTLLDDPSQFKISCHISVATVEVYLQKETL